MRTLITLVLLCGLAGCTLPQAYDQDAYNRWYWSLSPHDRRAEDQRELARIQAAGAILQGMAFRGGPLGTMPAPPVYPLGLTPVAPMVMPAPWVPSRSCVTMPAGGLFYTDC